MEIHKPKRWHGFREFLKEYLIIFVGVLTALAAEQGVEWLHWRHEVKEGRAALHREMAFDSSYFRDRITVRACLDRQLDKVQAALDSAAGGRPAALALPLLGPGRLTVTSQWAVEQASQIMTHFPREEMSSLSLWYDQTTAMKAWIEQEEEAWAKLAALDSPQAFAPIDLALARQQLQRARYLHLLMTTNAQRQLDRAEALGVAPDRPLATYVRGQCEERAAS
jgi:hypothetical protein